MKTAKIYSILFILINLALGAGTFFYYVKEHIKERKAVAVTVTQKAFSNWVDWKKEYPLSDDLKNSGDAVTAHNTLYDKIRGLSDKADLCIRINAPARMKFVELGHLFNKIIGKNVFWNLDNLIKLDNDYWVFWMREKSSFKEAAVWVCDFAKWLEHQKKKFAFILSPTKIPENYDGLPDGIHDYANENADSFLKGLSEGGAPYFDIRVPLREKYLDNFEAFFKTDHHWLPTTGLWAARQITGFLNETFGYNLPEELLTEENFNKTLYSKMFLGSQGKKVSLTLAGPEDFTLITPKFDTYFEFEAYCRDIKRHGTFEEALIDKSVINNDYYNSDLYTAYFGVELPVLRVINRKAANNIKLLCIKDSYSRVVLPFLACLVKEIVIVDVRRDQFLHFDGSVRKLIAKENPDTVLMMYSCCIFNRPESLSFNFK